MHELSIARALIKTAMNEARLHCAASVKGLHCRIGVLRMVDHQMLEEAFSVACRGTLCEHSRLFVEKSAPTVFCQTCRRRFPVSDDQWHCPCCTIEGVDFSGGDELELISIDLELDEHASTGEQPGRTERSVGHAGEN